MNQKTTSVEKKYFDIDYFEYLLSTTNRVKYKSKVKKKKKSIWFDVCLFFVSIICILSVSYKSLKTLTTQIVLSNNEKRLKVLEKDLSKILIENKNISDEIYSMVDQNYIKNVAFIKLSMFAPTEDNIIYFKKNNVGYVRQYENIK